MTSFTQKIKRRSFLAGATILTPAAALATSTADAGQPDWRERLLDVIKDLESPEGWEMHAVALAKAHAAGEIRNALGMEVPENADRDEYVAMTAGHRKRFEETTKSGAFAGV